ncbi:MAG: tetratricopeptide repeat protein [Proteobacteria bacterium]|nr:tetratricopeptide repeat protein [Pseudomonadota bacterium]
MTTSSQDPFAAAVRLHQAGRLAEAEALYRQVVAAEPERPEAHSNLGVALGALGRLDAAIACFEQAVALKPDYTDARRNLGAALLASGNAAAAESCFRQVLEPRPTDIEALNSLAAALKLQSRPAEAAAVYLRVLELEPNSADAYFDLGIAYHLAGRLDDAIAVYRNVLSLSPNHAEVHNNLGAVYLAKGNAAEAASCGRRALALQPDHAVAHGNLIFALDLDPQVDPATATEERRRWADRHAAPLAPLIRPHNNDRDPARQLRVGYVSFDFREHSAASVFGAVLLAHTPAIEVYCYSGTAARDATAERFRAKAKLWREVARFSDEMLANLIREDKIDILVDLSGFTAINRLLAFARKPAPIQVSAWGHPLGTGMAQMDYLFADPVFIPAAERANYVETIVDLPTAYPFMPLADAPDVAPLPATRRGAFTFGCFNHAPKLSLPAIEAWSAILRRVPDARFVLKDRTLDDQQTRDAMRERFTALGIGMTRLELRGWSRRHDHLAAYAEVDLALDPFPNNGGVSSLDGLWMGVPMVTLRGDRPQGRAGASLLTTLDLPQFITAAVDDYIATAVEWSGRRDELAALRAGLQRRMQASVICDHRAYCDAVEAAYRAMWRKWCGRA